MNRFVKIGSIVFLCGIIMASMSEAKTHQANVSNSVTLRNNSSGSNKGTTHSNSNTTKRSTTSSSTKTTSNNKNSSSNKGTTHSNSNTTKRSTTSSSTKTTSNNKNSSSNKGTTRPSSNTTKSPTNSSSTKPTSDNKNSSSNKGATRPGSNVTNQPTNAAPNNKDNGNNSGAIRPSGNVTNPSTNNPSSTIRNNRNSLGSNAGIKWEPKSDRPRYKYSNLHPKRLPLKPYKRPTPPRSFRPHRGCPVISDILGLTIGMALDLSMDYLFNKGYIIDRYGDNIVCLRDVNEFGFLWSYVILYYDDVGGLVGSQFSYSTSYYDLSRYNSLYNMLISRYGNPVSTQNTGTGLNSTWFGYDNQYISIGFTPMYAENGQLRYYTTLSFGV